MRMGQVRAGRGGGLDGGHWRMRQLHPGRPELPAVHREEAVRVETQVRRVGAEAPPHVDVAEERFEPLSLKRPEEVGPDPGLPARLLERLPTEEAGLPQGRTDARTLHAAILATGV